MFSQRVNKSQKGTRHVAGRDAEIMGHERVNKVCHVPQQLNRMSLYIQTVNNGRVRSWELLRCCTSGDRLWLGTDQSAARCSSGISNGPKRGQCV